MGNDGPKPAEVEVRAERRQGWVHTLRGARLRAFSASAPLHETLKQVNGHVLNQHPKAGALHLKP